MQDVDYVLDEEDLCNLLEENTPIYLVTGRGVKDNIGYYGWVISTVMEKVYESKGHAPGPLKQMESLRAESIGLLSILCFLTHYVHYHNLNINNDQWIHYCNNMSEVRRIKWMNIRTVIMPSACIQADMDAHFQIEEYLHQLTHTLTAHHVKGHQTSPNLPWEAQLNNRADELASEAQKQLTNSQKTGATTKYPASK
eukprot:10393649-Ditylum_brightwellii.AAC.1